MGLLLSGPAIRSQTKEPQEPQQPQESEDENTFDPVRAAKDMQVGDFYFRRGNYDAAIMRYKDAAQHRPNFAIPYLRIAKAYEKKKDLKSAIEAYQKYLQILPKGKDAPYARKQIEELQRKLEETKKS